MNSNSCVARPGVLLIRSFVAACTIFGALLAGAADPVIITSLSKQFVIRGLPQRSVLASSANESVVYVDPSLLAVTCERVKQALAKELSWGDRWHATILINVRPIRFDNEQPEIRVLRTPDGWRYRLDLPDEVDRTRLLQALVETVLLEYANRTAGHQSAELPPWLTEGLTAHMMQGPLSAMAIQPHAINLRHRGQKDASSAIRRRMQQTGMLTVDQLNWPDFDRNDASRADAYHYSAHLFVRELLRLRGGADCLCAMLAMLPEHLNWQTAFLRAFEPHFRRMLDVEKWWALTTTQLKTRDTSIHWSFTEAQQKLEEILYTPMQVRLMRTEMPHMAPVSLQTVINDWEFTQQVNLLQAKLTQLHLARVRLPGELGPLADSYRTALEKYLRVRQNAWFSATGLAAAKDAIAQLNALDEQRSKSGANVLTAASVPDSPPEVPLTPR